MKLRIEQRKNESVDFVALRAFVLAMPQMDDDSLRAFAGYVHSRAFAELIDRKKRRSGD